jgi:hypothetical protein
MLSASIENTQIFSAVPKLRFQDFQRERSNARPQMKTRKNGKENAGL